MSHNYFIETKQRNTKWYASLNVTKVKLLAQSRSNVFWVKEIGGIFRVVKEFDYGNGAGVNTGIMPGIKAYKTLKGAEKALAAWKPERYQMTRVEGLMQEGKI